jgi:hypothetical protein
MPGHAFLLEYKLRAHVRAVANIRFGEISSMLVAFRMLMASSDSCLLVVLEDGRSGGSTALACPCRHCASFRTAPWRRMRRWCAVLRATWMFVRNDRNACWKGGTTRGVSGLKKARPSIVNAPQTASVGSVLYGREMSVAVLFSQPSQELLPWLPGVVGTGLAPSEASSSPEPVAFVPLDAHAPGLDANAAASPAMAFTTHTRGTCAIALCMSCQTSTAGG